FVPTPDSADRSSHTLPLVTFAVCVCDHYRDLPSFPTRRSSDLAVLEVVFAAYASAAEGRRIDLPFATQSPRPIDPWRTAGQCAGDRKSTRLNSSHQIISYAVFCLKKKNYQSKSDQMLGVGWSRQ